MEICGYKGLCESPVTEALLGYSGLTCTTRCSECADDEAARFPKVIRVPIAEKDATQAGLRVAKMLRKKST